MKDFKEYLKENTEKNWLDTDSQEHHLERYHHHMNKSQEETHNGNHKRAAVHKTFALGHANWLQKHFGVTVQ